MIVGNSLWLTFDGIILGIEIFVPPACCSDISNAATFPMILLFSKTKLVLGVKGVGDKLSILRIGLLLKKIPSCLGHC